MLIVTMNRPQARNALTGPMMALMRQAWDQVDSDPGIRVCVLTGAGGAFCAGADLKAMTSAHPGDRFRAGDMDLSVIEPLLKGRRLTKPLIAAVEGAAIAGGTEILQADRHPGGGRERAVRRSPRRAGACSRWAGRRSGCRGRSRTRSPPTCCSPAGTSPPPRRCEIGLIGHVVPDGQALARALEIAELIAANGPVAVRAILQVIRETEGMPENEAFAFEAKIGMAVFAQRGRQGGPARLRREAPAAVPRPLARRLPGHRARVFWHRAGPWLAWIRWSARGRPSTGRGAAACRASRSGRAAVLTRSRWSSAA